MIVVSGIHPYIPAMLWQSVFKSEAIVALESMNSKQVSELEHNFNKGAQS